MNKSLGLAVVAATALSGCMAGSPGGYDSDLNRKTAGAAVISSFAQMCGARRIDQYRESFINKMKAEREVSADAEQQIRMKFKQSDAMLAQRIPTAAERKAYCKEHPARQNLIDSGIAGDFTGQI